jgi:hypothetical protein
MTEFKAAAKLADERYEHNLHKATGFKEDA